MSKVSLSVVAVIFALGTRASLTAHDETFKARFSPDAGPNAYSVQFPAELGGQQIEMPVVGGSLTLVVNDENETARLESWVQNIQPIELFGASTGPITVTLDDAFPTSGIYDPAARKFEVTATFILEFDDSQLSQFGFVSPFRLTATEKGKIFGVGQIGTIGMNLAGTGQFGLGEFTYTCKTSAAIESTRPEGKTQAGDCNQDNAHDISDPVSMLTILFQGSLEGCPAAIDVNGDAQRDISDAIFMFSYLFEGSTPPPADEVDC